MLNSIYLFLNLGGGEIMIVLLVVLLFFGSSKIPEFARGLGKGIRQFKDATDGIQRDIQSSVNEVKEDIDIQKQVKDTIAKATTSEKKEDTQQT
jgi:sec-independent protein translocase protein TatA